MLDTHLLRIAGAYRLDEDVAVFSLVSPDGTALQPFTPGSHLNAEPAPGLVRQFSLLGDPNDRSAYQIGVKLARGSRGGSRAMHLLADAAAQPGRVSHLRVSGPRNLFALVDTAPHHVLLGAGIGITPMLSMAASLWQQAASFSLDYFSARAEGGAFTPLLRQSPYAKRVSIHEGRARTDIAVQVRERVAQCPSDAHIYVCGPDGFMASAVAITQELGAGARVHLERFQAPAENDSPTSEPSTSFRIVLARRGSELEVPADRSIADVLDERRIACDIGCRQGVCGACVTRVLDGIPDHRDSVLTPEEQQSNQLICVCVSRSRTPTLRLDL